MEKLLNQFVEDLKNVFKDRLTSVILYGSCAVDDYCKKSFSDLNVMVVMNNLCAQDLKDAGKITLKFFKKSKSLPVFMDEAEWFNSADVYAIEYSDIKDRNRILYGKDIVSVLTVEKYNLRIQCEREVKNLLIRLRQIYLANSNNKKVIKELIIQSSKSFVVIFRTILRLLDTQVPAEHMAVVESFSDKLFEQGLPFDKDLFISILEFRNNPHRIKSKELIRVIQRLIDSTDYVLKYVDKIKV